MTEWPDDVRLAPELKHMSPAPPDGDVALFIDWENFKYSLYEVGQVPDLAALVQAVRERYGRPALARAYADWQDYYHRKSFDQMNLYAVGIEPVYVPTPAKPHAAEPDQEQRGRADEPGLPGGSLHPPALADVRAGGRRRGLPARRRRAAAARVRVIMIGVSGCTSQRLAAVVDELLFYDLDIGRSQSAALAPKSRPAAQPLSLPPPPPLPTCDGNNATRPSPGRRPGCRRADPGSSGPPAARSGGGTQLPHPCFLAAIADARSPPVFRASEVRFPQFKDFVLHLERQGLVKVQTVDLTNRVWLAEDVAEMERESPPVPAPDDSWTEDGHLVQQRDQFADIVLTADDIENSHREYMGRGLLARFLYNKGHWDPADLPARAAPIQSPAWGDMEMPEIHRLLDAAVDEGY